MFFYIEREQREIQGDKLHISTLKAGQQNERS